MSFQTEYRFLYGEGTNPGTVGWDTDMRHYLSLQRQVNKLAAEGWVLDSWQISNSTQAFAVMKRPVEAK